MVVIAGYPCIQLSKIFLPAQSLADKKLYRSGASRRFGNFVSPSLPAVDLVEMIGIEPTTSGLQSRRSPN